MKYRDVCLHTFAQCIRVYILERSFFTESLCASNASHWSNKHLFYCDLSPINPNFSFICSFDIPARCGDT